MKYLILVGDGMGDRPIAELGDKTPLEFANTPAMDTLCKNGSLFLTETVPDGFPPGSDVANLSLLGYHPQDYYTGRAPVEAAAMGITLKPSETAFRCNLVTLDYLDNDKVEMIDFSAGHITTAEAAELIHSLQEECGTEIFQFKAGISYRHLLLLTGDHPDLATVPPHDHIGKDVSHPWLRYINNPDWKVLLTKAKEVLTNHPINSQRIANGLNPANGIWLWGEGKQLPTPTLKDRFGLNGSLISAVDLLKGLGINAGLSIINVPGATGYIDTNYEGKAKAALTALENDDFVFVHVEAPDEAGHQGSLKYKIQAIEDFDSRIVEPIIDGLMAQAEDFRVIVTMDHFTPLEIRTHSSDPVPVILYDSTNNASGCGLSFSEKSGIQSHKESQAVLLSGQETMELLLQKKANTSTI